MSARNARELEVWGRHLIVLTCSLVWGSGTLVGAHASQHASARRVMLPPSQKCVAIHLRGNVAHDPGWNPGNSSNSLHACERLWLCPHGGGASL